MNRRELEHIIRAVGAIAESSAVVILSSQALLGSFPDAPAELLASQEADLYPLNEPERADLIDGSIGELSPFHEQFGYYAHGVGAETAILPSGWRLRPVPICNENTRGVTGYCLHPSDVAVSKLLAGRDKDLRFVAALMRHRMVSRQEITALFAELPRAQAERASAALAAV